MEQMLILGGIGIVVFVFVLILAKSILSLRRVVGTNEIHIVQKNNNTVSYGKDTGNGNVYYAWPAWLPVIGITCSILPTNNFELDLKNYEAYDKGRLPLVLDIVAFFRISDSNVAAQRISSLKELDRQLTFIVQGAARTILAKSDIEQIMEGRGEFGELFTNEVKAQLEAWGVMTVKNIELMDIRDAQNSKVISNIMAKKKSLIEMESRKEVAENNKTAEMAELQARQEVELKKQEVVEQVGLRTVSQEKTVAVAQQIKEQEIAETSKITTEKQMEVSKISNVKKAEIVKETAIIAAEQEKQSNIIKAEGQLESKKREAEGVKVAGEAKADADKAIALATVAAQVELAAKIGNDEKYQQYLVTVKQIEANRDIGIEQAKSLQKAEIKVVATAGTPAAGLNSAMDIFSANGGAQLGAMVETFAQTEAGKQILAAVLPKKG